ncbi:hypothetical protein THITH_01870 [Thioalkalivibrio paradoxus ARh 1]|uniref:Uncharacterized protein n=1 Tax=Thioalkalivibrio paradoxus ARh 1 TaxID=713585 RepID=W0DMN9_9GAMM|nr:hypothetical protein THITH_01870 [Thioalkalivibrio paradoxus ARh 1]
MKSFVADSLHDALNGPLPVTRLTGTMVGVAGRKQHSGYPFVGIRTVTPFAEIETGIVEPTDPRLGPETLAALGISR